MRAASPSSTAFLKTNRQNASASVCVMFVQCCVLKIRQTDSDRGGHYFRVWQRASCLIVGEFFAVLRVILGRYSALAGSWSGVGENARLPDRFATTGLREKVATFLAKKKKVSTSVRCCCWLTLFLATKPPKSVRLLCVDFGAITVQKLEKSSMIACASG